MKKLILSVFAAAAFMGSAKAYNTVTVQDSISTNTHWTNDQQYLLKGYVYVTAGATLTIDSGCIIKGDKVTKGALIVERGAKLIAVGTATAPIVFTSNQPVGQRTYGDWGGVILCGKSPNNWNGGTAQVEGGPRSLYGGTDAHDNSGQLAYVRIEFPGIAFSPNNEINGLTLCSVGDATQLDHIQVSYSGDDSYEWFGGSVNAKYLVAFRTWDDDFDTDNGYRGKVQFGVSQRDPYAADQSGSKTWESDSYQSGTATGLTDTTMLTRPVFSNITAIGPLVSPTSTAYDPQYIAGAHIRRGSAISILNSIIAGYPAGVLIDESSASFGSTTANIGNDAMQFRNNIIAGIPTNSTPSPKEVMYVKDGARNLTVTTTEADTTTNNPFNPFTGPYGWVLNPSYGNKIYATEQNGVRLQTPFDLSNPNFIPTSTSPIIYNAAHVFNPANPINTDTTNSYANYNVPTMVPDFTNSKASDAFFTLVNYVGAFGGNGNWMSGWTNFDPTNTDYTSNVNTAGTTTAVNTLANVVRTAVVYPNPAAQTATVVVDLTKTGTVAISLADVTGKLVQRVFNGTQAAGTQTFQLDLKAVPAGTYFVRIATEGGQQTLKLNVTK